MLFIHFKHRISLPAVKANSATAGPKPRPERWRVGHRASYPFLRKYLSYEMSTTAQQEEKLILGEERTST